METPVFKRRNVPAYILCSFLLSMAAPSLSLAADAGFGFTVRSDVMIPMRDGVNLAADIYLPASNNAAVEGKLPVILRRTPYKKETYPEIGRYFASFGYAVVFQDVRGRYKSEGVWHMLTDDGKDGFDTCEWISRQPWSNGRIGMFGISYEGGTQHALAMENSPYLTTVIPTDAMSNLGYESMRYSGAFELRFWNWIYTWSADGSREAKDPGTKSILEKMRDDRKYYLMNLPLRKGTTPLKLAPEYEDWLVDAMRHGANDDFWKQNDILDYTGRYKDMPIYLVGGWYDSWGGNTTANYKALTGKIKGPIYLIMGPWIHARQTASSHGQVSFGKDAAIPDQLAWWREWFDHWLKGIDNTVGKAAPFASPVRIFVMGSGDGRKDADGKLNHGGFWRNEQEWPLARTQYTKYYLHSGGVLSPNQPDDARSSTTYMFDPRDPVPTIGGNISSGNDILQQGGWDQRGGPDIWNWTQPIPLSARRDILVFRTGPLEQDMEVTGEITVSLWASSSALDTDFTAKLIDVYPPNPDFPGGFDLNLEDGIIRARFRDTLKEEHLMKPGDVYQFTIKLYPTSNIFKKGHRIRLDISSSNFPRFDVNPNSGEPLNEHRRLVSAVNTVQHDRSHPSHIVLPIIPAQTK